MVNPNQEPLVYPTNALLIGNQNQDDFGKINRIRFMSDLRSWRTSLSNSPLSKFPTPHSPPHNLPFCTRFALGKHKHERKVKVAPWIGF